MKKTFSLIGLVFLLWSCESKPTNLLSPEKLSDVQIDLQLAESRVYRYALPFELASQTFKRLQKEIFAKHKIDSATYYSSYNYYLTTNTKTMEQIYQRTSDSLEVLQKRILENEKKPKQSETEVIMAED
jgi:hypothetical protein